MSPEIPGRFSTGKAYGVPAPDGSDAIAGKGLANCDGCGSDKQDWFGNTAPVGSFPANRFGLHDMSGNVLEWVEDTHQTYPDRPTGAEVLGSKESDVRVLRGGSWFDNPDSARASARSNNYDFPDFLRNSFGFRVLCSSPIE